MNKANRRPMCKLRPALPDLRDGFESMSTLLYQDTSLFFNTNLNITNLKFHFGTTMDADEVWCIFVRNYF